MSDPEKIAADEVVAWLAFLAHEGETLGEGELAAALGVDRVAARDVILRGAEVAQRVVNARVERVRREVAEASRVDGFVGARAYGTGAESVRRLFADGRERTAPEVAAALGIEVAAATKRLLRCAAVHRARPGVWALKPEVQP